MSVTVKERPASLTLDRLYIGGEWVEPADGTVAESIDPSTGAPVALVAVGGPADVDRAVAAAREAFRPGSRWRTMPTAERSLLLYRLAECVRRDAAELAALETRDNGSTIKDALGDVAAVANAFAYYAGLADKIEGTTIPIRSDWHAYTVREPVGVVGAITPWNGPLLMYSWKLGPALAAGCTVVLKPAEQTPVTALKLAELIEEVGFPAGVVNVVTGDGPGPGARLVAHPDVDKIAFTGSHPTAQGILRTAADTMKHVSTECGGKAPHIVFADADLERALDVTAYAAFRRCGQSCTQGSRVLVQREIYDRFVDGVTERAQRMRIGDPLDERTMMGPHTFEEKLQNTLDYVALGQQEGASLVWGGDRIEGDGYFIRPGVFAGVSTDMRIAQEEIFGPVATILPFGDDEEAVAIANDVQYGLTAGLWTTDVRRAHSVAARIEAGAVSVNMYPPVHWALPYGGMKLSGLGRENGVEAIDLYTETKTTLVDLGAGAASPFAD